MALGQRPTKQELTRKDIFQLIDGLLYDPSFASLYRAELHTKTRAVTADDTLGGWLRRRHLRSNSGLDYADEEEDHNEGVRDVRKIINDYKRAESLRPAGAGDPRQRLGRLGPKRQDAERARRIPRLPPRSGHRGRYLVV
jgi:hypothetical protein